MKYIRLQSHTGHFNLLNPEEESVSTRVSLWEYGSEQPIFATSIRTDYEISEMDFDYSEVADETIELLAQEDRRYLISTNRDKVLNLKKLVEESKQEIVLGQKQFLIDSLKRRKEQLEEQATRISKRLQELTEETQ